MVHDTYLVIDFDSTFITIETIDELARISIGDDSSSIQKIKEITNMAMSGKIDFCDALSKRIKIITSTKNHINQLVNDIISNHISPSFLENKDFIKNHSDSIYIVSGGFREVIEPVVSCFGISANHVIANSFTYQNNRIVGYKTKNIMATKLGKVDAVKGLLLDGRVIAIGDGYTDYQIKEFGLANDFIAYTESVSRTNVIANADFVASSFNEVIGYLK